MREESALFIFKVVGYYARSRRSDSGERCEVKKEMKSREGTGKSGAVPSHTSPPPSFLFFPRSYLLRTSSHYLNAWNRLLVTKSRSNTAFRIFTVKVTW